MELKDFAINNLVNLVCTQPVEKTTEGNNLFQILNENTAYNIIHRTENGFNSLSALLPKFF